MTTLGRLRGALKSFCYSGPFRDRWQQPDRVLTALEVARGQRVVDLGAGGGYFTYRMARAVGRDGRVYAVDPDPDMRAWVGAGAARRGYANVVTVGAGPDEPPALPERVEVILIVDAFHHLPDDRVGYFSALADALRLGGVIAVIEPLPRWYLFGHATAPNEIESVMTTAGYVAATRHDFLKRQSFTVFRRA